MEKATTSIESNEQRCMYDDLEWEDKYRAAWQEALSDVEFLRSQKLTSYRENLEAELAILEAAYECARFTMGEYPLERIKERQIGINEINRARQEDHQRRFAGPLISEQARS